MQVAVDFWVYFSILRKRLWLTILLFLVTVGVILAMSYTAKPVYRASVRLQVLSTDSSDISLFSQGRTVSSVDEIQQAQNDFMRALGSGFVAWKTIADLNLEIGAADLLSGLGTSLEGQFIVVTVESDNPGRAEAIATTQVNNALEYYRKVRATPSRVLGEFVAGLVISDTQRMLDAEQAFLDFKQKNNLDSIKQETQALQDLIRNLKVERERAQIEQDKADIFAKSYRDEQKKANTKVAEIDAMNKGAADAKPSTEVAPSTRKFYEDVARQNEAEAISYEAKRDGYARSLAIYDQAIEERTTELRNLLKISSDYNALERALAQATSDYNFVTAKQNEAFLKQAQAERLGYIQITEPARKPDAPVPTKTLQLALVGGAVSLLVGFVLSFLLEFLDSLRKVAQKRRVS
jgi:uncharacterized protein involved in exopolysaccharide biosynthesis